ncbi:MAG: rhodanese-like domain-containing protein [Eubacteriales bacterium]|nr:rhodanese-like domain-containing protein [Eubacteriales bacterium]
MRKKYIAGIIAIALVAGIFIYQKIRVKLFVSENENGKAVSIIGGSDGPTSVFIAGKVGGDDTASYTSISMEDAKKLFENEGDYIILDVRRADEYAEGHIPNAINIANEEIGGQEPAELKDKNQTIYAYCRSGRRSQEAAGKLAALGYTNIIECGGILDWTGDIEQ